MDFSSSNSESLNDKEQIAVMKKNIESLLESNAYLKYYHEKFDSYIEKQRERYQYLIYPDQEIELDLSKFESKDKHVHAQVATKT